MNLFGTEKVQFNYSNLCIATSAASISLREEGTLCPEIGAASETPASFFAFHTTELNSTKSSVFSVQD